MPTLHLFGIPRLVVRGRADITLSPREAGLLAWLHLEGPSPRAQLAGLLWPAGGESQARANLRQALARLRRAAGEVLAESDGVLRLAGEVEVAAPAVPAATPAAQRRLLGPLEFDEATEFAEWLQRQREAAVREHRRQQLSAARQHLDCGALDEALAAAEAVLADDAAVEDAHRLRMEVFYLRGDRAAAISAWDDCRDALRQAYGIAPSAATNELGRLVLAAEAAGQQQARAARAVAGAVLPAALRRPPQLVGREAAMAHIVHAFALGHAVLVAGPGGMGKSRLMAEAASAVEPALAVGGRPGDDLQPGAVVSRLLAAAVERFAPPLDSPTRADIALLLPGGAARGPGLRSALEQRRLLASVARAVHACHRRGLQLVVVDDLQFVDDLSIEALTVITGDVLAQPAEVALRLLFGCRPDELRPAAASLVELWSGNARCDRIDLGPWTAADIQALLHTLPLPSRDARAAATLALAQALQARVGGNPAFVLESVKSLWLGGWAGWRPGQPLVVPATLVESLRRRLARLSDEAMQLVQLAAVARDDLDLPLAAAALGRPPLALAPLFAELEAAQVLEGVRFSHDLVAEAARASVPTALLAPLHRVVADHLMAHGGAAGRIAWHLQQAGDDVAAVPWHLAAGQAARHRWQLADAARSFEAAALGLERRQREGQDGPPGIGSSGPSAVVPAGSAAPGAAADDLPATVATTWLQAARWWTAVSDYPAALRALERGRASARSQAEHLELQASQVVVLLNSQRVADATAQAMALADALRAEGDALPAERLAAALFACVAVAPHAPQPQRLAGLWESLRHRCESGPARARLSFHLAVGSGLNWLGRPLQAEADLAQARRLADPFQDHGSIVNITHQQLRQALLVGDAARADAAAHDCGVAVQAGGYGRSFRLHAWAAQALAAVAAARPAQVLQALQSLEADLDGVDLAAEEEVAAVRALAWCAVGRADRAMPMTDGGPADTLGPGERLPPCEGWWALVHWRLHADPRVRQQALAALARRWPAEDGLMGWRRRVLQATLALPGADEAEALVAELRARGLAPWARRAHVIAGRCALATGRSAGPARAAAHARRALALATRIDPWIDDAGSVWVESATLLRASNLPGTEAEAEAALDRGRAWLAQAADTLTDEAARGAWLLQTANAALRGASAAVR